MFFFWLLSLILLKKVPFLKSQTLIFYDIDTQSRGSMCYFNDFMFFLSHGKIMTSLILVMPH